MTLLENETRLVFEIGRSLAHNRRIGDVKAAHADRDELLCFVLHTEHSFIRRAVARILSDENIPTPATVLQFASRTCAD